MKHDVWIYLHFRIRNASILKNNKKQHKNKSNTFANPTLCRISWWFTLRFSWLCNATHPLCGYIPQTVCPQWGVLTVVVKAGAWSGCWLCFPTHWIWYNFPGVWPHWNYFHWKLFWRKLDLILNLLEIAKYPNYFGKLCWYVTSPKYQ